VRRHLARVLNEADHYVQSLNNRFADPSGHSESTHKATSGVASGATPVASIVPASPDVSIVKQDAAVGAAGGHDR
jgi:hypothetical protein